MEFDSIDCMTSSDAIDDDEIHHRNQLSSLLKTHSNNENSNGNVSSAVHPSTTSVHELLECPACTNSMYPPIHQCHNGHTLCSACNTRVQNRCPTWRKELGDVRCLALEKVAESLELPCKYTSVGCPEIFPYYSKLKHEALCNFRPYNCQYAGSELKSRSWGNGRKLIWEGTPRSIRDGHGKVRDRHDGLIILRNMVLFFSGGDRKELKLRVTGRIWKGQQNPEGGACIPNLCS